MFFITARKVERGGNQCSLDKGMRHVNSETETYEGSMVSGGSQKVNSEPELGRPLIFKKKEKKSQMG